MKALDLSRPLPPELQSLVEEIQLSLRDRSLTRPEALDQHHQDLVALCTHISIRHAEMRLGLLGGSLSHWARRNGVDLALTPHSRNVSAAVRTRRSHQKPAPTAAAPPPARDAVAVVNLEIKQAAQGHATPPQDSADYHRGRSDALWEVILLLGHARDRGGP